MRGAASRSGTAADHNHIVKLKPLNADDVATMHKISHTPAISRAMDDAWQQTLKDGQEHGFVIYRDGDRYFSRRDGDGQRRRT